MRLRRLVLGTLVLGAVLALAACDGGETGSVGAAGPAGAAGAAGPAGPAGEAGEDGLPGADAPALEAAELSCTGCHEDTGIIVSKNAQLAQSVHGAGGAYVRGSSERCAGCHGSEGPMARIRAGGSPHDESIVGVVNVSPYNCRTCHQIHTTYTEDDFNLEGDQAPVTLEMTGGTFDGGPGNLCVNCHQFRNELPVAVDGMIEIATTRFGPHYGAESQMLLGEGGLGVTGSVSPHYEEVEGTCAGCHMGEERNHTFVPAVSRCVTCHEGIDSFDLEGVQTEVEALMDELHELLIGTGIIDVTILDSETGEIGHRTVEGVYPEAVASAMWNYMFIYSEQSHGVHNPLFAKTLLTSSIEALTAAG